MVSNQPEKKKSSKAKDKNASPIKKVKSGSFHEWLGKSKDKPITEADIQRGLKSPDPHIRKMAQFAKNSKKWNHKKKPATESMDLGPVPAWTAW